MAFNQISHINVFAKDPKKLISFYRDVLGISPLEGQSEDSSWYGFQTEGVEFAIEPQSNRERVAKELGIKRKDISLIQLKASSLEELEEMSNHLEKKGVEILCRAKKRSYGYCTNFVDPEGNFLEIYYPGE
jgi:predicted enzyme related to lactoylglutathione lyase